MATYYGVYRSPQSGAIDGIGAGDVLVYDYTTIDPANPPPGYVALNSYADARGASIEPLSFSEIDSALRNDQVDAVLFSDKSEIADFFHFLQGRNLAEGGGGGGGGNGGGGGGGPNIVVFETRDDGSIVTVPIETVFTGAPGYVVGTALLYSAGLGRPADLPGLNFWIDQFEAGVGWRELADNFLESTEFKGKYGDDDTLGNRQFVDVMYRNVLQRAGEASGIQYWEGQLGNGVTHEEVLLEFANSIENRERSDFTDMIRESEPGYWVF